MKLLDISLNSLRRRKSRMAFLVLGLLIAVGTVVTLVSVAEQMNSEIATSLDEYGANIIIVPRSEDLSLTYGGVAVSSAAFDLRTLSEEDARAIRTIKNKENISIVAPKLLTAVNVQRRTVLAVGVDFTQELRLKKWWSLTGRQPIGETDAILGSDAAATLGLGLNQELELSGETFTVAAVLQPTGSEDDAVVFIDLTKAQRLFKRPGQLSLIEVAALCYDCPIDEIVRQTSEKLPGAKVTAIRQTIESKMEATHRFEHFSVGISIIVLIVGILIVFTSMTASVYERTREIGVFRAIGFRQAHIIRVILTEALLTSLLAGLLGYFTGLGASRFVSIMVGITATPHPAFSPGLLAFSVALSILVGLAGSVYPAVKASRLDPSVALKAL
jgi:putative ABC transport system permease protein